MPKQIQLSTNTLKKIAEALFLAYTAEQAAYLGGISKTTLKRIQATPLWQEIEEKALLLEKPFRKKVWQGGVGWQGAAWMLERKYPGQLSKPEVQLNLSAGSVTNNTLIITAETAAGLQKRASAMDSELAALAPRKIGAGSESTAAGSGSSASRSANKQGIAEVEAQLIGSDSQIASAGSAASTSPDASVREEERGPSAPRTPPPARVPPMPGLGRKSENLGNSSNLKPSSNSGERKKKESKGKLARELLATGKGKKPH